MTSRILFALVFLLALAPAAVSHAQTAWTWTFVGAPLGITSVNEVAVDPWDDDILYVSVMTGLLSTRDGGSSWSYHTAAGPSHAVVVSPTNAERVYAAVNEDLYRSEDRGLTWSPVFTAPNSIYSLHVSPADSSVYVGVHWWGVDHIDDGIYKSTDHGDSWTYHAYGSGVDNSIPWDIEEDEVNGVLYIVGEIADHAEPYDPPFMRSFDGGATWERLHHPEYWHAGAIQIHPTTRDLYLLGEGSGLFRSSDFGTTFEPVSNDFYLTFLIDPNDPHRMYGGGGHHPSYGWYGGFYDSSTTGAQFDKTGLSDHVVGSLCLNGDGSRVFATSYGSGVWVADRPALSLLEVFPDGSGTYPTIQAAVDAAADGDLVMLHEGLYSGPGNRDISIVDKAIAVQSFGGDPSRVIVNCEEAGRGFHIVRGGLGTRVVGLTVRKGYAATGGYLDNLGGGLFLQECADGPILAQVVTEYCQADSHGGGVHAGFHGDPIFRFCRFVENTSGGTGGGFVSGYGASYACSPYFYNCDFVGNTAASGGGASIAQNGLGTATVVKGTFLGNTAGIAGGLKTSAASLDMRRCTFALNSAPIASGIELAGGLAEIDRTLLSFGVDSGAVTNSGAATLVLTDCDVYDNAGGDYVDALAGLEGTDGNFSADPLFCDLAGGDLHYDTDSPCLTRNNAAGVRIGAVSQGCGGDLTWAPPDAGLPNAAALSCWPNPFNPSMTIAFTMHRAGPVEVAIHDLHGRRIRTLLAEPLPAGPAEIHWDGRDSRGRGVASGAYLVRVKEGAREMARTVLLLK